MSGTPRFWSWEEEEVEREGERPPRAMSLTCPRSVPEAAAALIVLRPPGAQGRPRGQTLTRGRWAPPGHNGPEAGWDPEPQGVLTVSIHLRRVPSAFTG